MSEPQKDRKGKVEPTLVDPEFIRAIARVRMYGNQKYPDKDNWKGNPVEFYRDAAYRHWLQYLDGEYYDEESGLPHLAHLACNTMFIQWMEENKEENEEILSQQVRPVEVGPQGSVDMFGNLLPIITDHPTLGKIMLMDITENDFKTMKYQKVIDLTKDVQRQELTKT